MAAHEATYAEIDEDERDGDERDHDCNKVDEEEGMNDDNREEDRIDMGDEAGEACNDDENVKEEDEKAESGDAEMGE